MSKLNKMIDILNPLGVDAEFEDYTGSDDTYIRFFFMPEVQFDGDDGEVYITHYVQVDVFSKWDFTQLVKDVQQALRDAGLKRNFVDEQYEKDTKLHHKILRYYFITQEE